MNNNDELNSPQKPIKKRNRDLKIIIVGDSGTGKTSFVNRYILNKFDDNYQITIASQLSSKIIVGISF